VELKQKTVLKSSMAKLSRGWEVGLFRLQTIKGMNIIFVKYMYI